MNRMNLCGRTVAALLVIVLFALAASLARAQLPADVKSDLGEGVPPLKVRPGYRVTRALPAKVKPVKNIRFIQFSADGKTLFISNREEGEIYALRDPDKEGVFQTVTVFVKDKRSVQGMDVHGDGAQGGWLYFSQAGEGSVSRARDSNGDGVADEVENVIPPGTLPKGGGH